MKESKKHILLIAYTFPPYPGIGGRRWAKFAKYLTVEGYTIHVISASNPFQETSLWNEDVINNPNIKVYRLSGFYPKVFQKNNDFNLFEKLQYRFWSKSLPLMIKGTIYDKAIFGKQALLKKAKELINENSINNVIVTGAPFRSLFYSSELKKMFPDINLIADFRDPWTEGKSYGFATLSEKRKLYEFEMEESVCKTFDSITAPSGKILEYLNEKHQIRKNKTIVIPHAFDEYEFVKAKELPARTDDKIKVNFSGTIYEGSEDYFTGVFNLLEKIRIQSPELYIRLQIDFFVSGWNNLSDIVKSKGLDDTIKFSPPLKPQDLFCEIADSDYVLVVFIEKYKNYLSTKFYEIINLNKFIIYIGPDGDVSEFIVKNKLGVAISDIKNFDVLTDLFMNKRQSVPYPQIQNYSFNNVTKEIVKLFA